MTTKAGTQTPKKKPSNYSSKHIETQRFPENIRQSPAMYIGGVDSYGMWTCVKELLDNGADEFMAGRNEQVTLFLDNDSSYWVWDSGHGIPQGEKQWTHSTAAGKQVFTMATMEAVFGELHTSGKYRTDAYAISIGCFTGDTKIRLLSGKTVSFEKLYARWKNNKKPIPIMTWDTEKDQVAYSNISHVQLSKFTDDLVRVKFDSGDVTTCTPDHPFFVRRDGKVERVLAKDLQPEDSLVAVHLKKDQDGYLYSYDLKRNQGDRGQSRLHRSVASYYDPKTDFSELEVHHEDRNRQNNRWTNLEITTQKDHHIEHEEDRRIFSREKMMNDPKARFEKSLLMSSLNEDEDLNEVRVETKAVRSGVRALMLEGVLNAGSYSRNKTYGSLKWKNLWNYFEGRKEFVGICKRVFKYHCERSQTHKSSEDWLRDLRSSVNNQVDVNTNNSMLALFATWKKQIDRAGIEVSTLTPEQFNSTKKGVGVFGSYATLRKWTSLKELKAAILENRMPTFYDDLSPSAQERRALVTESRMRGIDGRKRVIHKFALAVRRLGTYTESEYMDAKSSTDPQWRLGTACIEFDHGIECEEELLDFLKNYNHSVVSVKRFKAKKPVPVYGMTVDNQHTYFIEPGVLVANTHGVGAKGTNATAEFFDVVTCYSGKWYSVKFERGVITQHVKPAKAPRLPNGETLKKGTLIHFKPDAKIFSVKSFPPSMAVEWAEIMSYMNPGLRITIQSRKSKKTFFSKIGPQEYIQHRLEKLKVEGERVMFVHKDELSDVVVAFANYDGCDLRGMTNSVTNSQGGKHVDSVTGALFEGLRPFIKTKKVDGKVVPVFREADLKEGLVGLVNAKLHKAQFSSQDKAKLVDGRVGKEYEEALAKVTKKFFVENKALAQRLCERATKLNELKTKFTLSKRAASSLNAVKRNGLPAKYAGYDSKTKVHDRELFIVEGDSASGSTKEARFPYQAILPLKGKIISSLKDTKGKALESEEVINILAAIGYDPKAADPYTKLTVGKIICLADPDPDGPFVGDTSIRIRHAVREGIDAPIEIKEGTVPIYMLAEWTFTGSDQFEVPVFINGREEWKPATAELVRNVDKLVALEIGKHKYKVSVEHKFLCIRTPSTRGRENLIFNEHLAFICADHMRIGDRLYYPAHDKLPKHDWDKQDKTTGLGFLAVNKLRVQEQSEPVPVYCLTVPRHHHFMLPSGIINSNCHINSLLLALFYKYLPELFKRGMVYVSAAPEFYSIHRGQLVYGDTVSAVQKKLKKISAPESTAINHLKGWGEAGKNLMKVFATDPETRRLVKIQALGKDDHVEFVKLMSDDVEYRREMLGLPRNAKDEEAPAAKVAKKTTVKKAVNDPGFQKALTKAVGAKSPKTKTTGRTFKRKPLNKAA